MQHLNWDTGTVNVLLTKKNIYMMNYMHLKHSRETVNTCQTKEVKIKQLSCVLLGDDV